MPVSKRLRFEILRRDNHQCRYCGGAAPDVKLTVDHVIPQTLGGSDDPSNLVTACEDCNAGKSSVHPDASIVADVQADALKWSAAMEKAGELRAADAAREADIIEGFECMWTNTWLDDPKADDTSTRYRHAGRRYARLPHDWQRSILQFVAAGLDMKFIGSAKHRAQHNDRIDWDDSWRYFCGICWRELDTRREIASSLLHAEESE